MCIRDSFKIEGRMKRPEYVSSVTRTYATAVRYGVKPGKREIDSLGEIFSRSGFTDVYKRQVLDTQEYEVDFSGVTLEEMPLVSALWWTKSAQTSRTPSEFSFIDNARLRNQGANWLSISHRPTNREGKSVGTCWNTPPMMIEKELELAAAGLEDAHDNGFLVIGKTDTMQFLSLIHI